jgi:hypothetical protein
MQMSENELFCFCEGKNNDKYFYSKILNGTLRKESLKRELKIANEIDGEGGKKALMAFFKYLRDNNSLVKRVFGKTICCIFFFDKDIDCLQRSKLRSMHAIYTEKYDVEASIFFYGELRDAVASSLSLDVDVVKQEHLSARKWCEAVAVSWKEWLAACIFSKIHSLDCGCGYARPSRINHDFIAPTDLNQYADFKEQMKVKSGLSEHAFEMAYSKIENVIERLIVRGDLFRLFKGKWLPQRARKEFEARYSQFGASFTNSTGERLLQAMLTSLPQNGNWLKHFRRRLDRPLADAFGRDVLIAA